MVVLAIRKREVMYMFLSNQMLTTIGLVLDIAGVCLLFRFGLSDSVRKDIPRARWIDVVESYEELTPQEREEDKIQMRQERRWKIISGIGQWLALVIIVVGFILQIIAEHVNKNETTLA